MKFNAPLSVILMRNWHFNEGTNCPLFMADIGGNGLCN